MYKLNNDLEWFISLATLVYKCHLPQEAIVQLPCTMVSLTENGRITWFLYQHFKYDLWFRQECIVTMNNIKMLHKTQVMCLFSVRVCVVLTQPLLKWCAMV